MSGQVDVGVRSFLPGANDIPQFARVTATATGCDIAGAADDTLGVAQLAGYQPDTDRDDFQEKIPVKLFTAEGSVQMIASAAIAAGDELGGAADGKVVTHSAGDKVGLALESASGDGSIIECLLYPPGTT